MKKSYKISSSSNIDEIINEIKRYNELSIKIAIPERIFTHDNQDAEDEEIISNNIISCIQRILSETNVIELDLSAINLTSENVQLIFENQKANKLKKLNIECNKIGDDGSFYIAEYLKYNSLESLNLEYNRIGPEGARFIAESLANSALKWLSFGTKDLGEFMMEYCNNLGDEGISYVVRALETNGNLEELYCANNQIRYEHPCLNGLKFNLNLKMLSLSYNNISSYGFYNLYRALENNSNIEGFFINNNPLSDSEAELIAKMVEKNDSLKLLNIHTTGITDIGITHISKILPKHQELKYLSLGGNDITPASLNDIIISLTIHTTIRSFNISNIKVDAHVVTSLITLLKNNSLIDLDLSNTGITRGQYEEISNVVKINRNLAGLNLSDNDLEDGSVIHILQNLKGNNSLNYLSMVNITGAQVEINDICGALKHNKALTSVVILNTNCNFETINILNQSIQIYTNRNKSYGIKLTKFIYLNQHNLKNNNELQVFEDLVEYSNCTNFTNPKTSINFFSLFFSVSKNFLLSCLEVLGNNDSKTLIQIFHEHIGMKFFYVARICKEFAEDCIFNQLPKELIIKIMVDYDVRLPSSPDYTIPLDVLCTGSDSEIIIENGIN